MSTDSQEPAAKDAAAAPPKDAKATRAAKERVHSADEDAVGWGEIPREDSDDERFLREVPPHHGS